MAFKNLDIRAVYNHAIEKSIAHYGEREGGVAADLGWDQLRFTSTFEINGLNALRMKFGAMRADVLRESRTMLAESGMRIKATSQERVPWYSGELHDSFYYGEPGGKDVEDAIYQDSADRLSLSLGYDTRAIPYAVIQHESTEYEHPANAPGRPYSMQPTAGFLSIPAEIEESRFKVMTQMAFADLFKRASTAPTNAPVLRKSVKK